MKKKNNYNEFTPKLPSPKWSTFFNQNPKTPISKTKTKKPTPKTKKKSPNKSKNSSFLEKLISAKKKLRPINKKRRTSSLIKIAQKMNKAPEPPKKKKKSPIGTKTRKTSDSKEENFEKIRKILEEFYRGRGKGKKSSSSRSSVNSSNSNTWFKSPVGSSLSSMNSSPKAKSKRVRFRSIDNKKTVSRYPQKRTSSNDSAYKTNKNKRRELELKQFKREINANRDSFGDEFATDVNALDIASVNFGINFQSVKYKLRENEFIEFKDKYPELFRE